MPSLERTTAGIAGMVLTSGNALCDILIITKVVHKGTKSVMPNKWH